VLSGTLDDGAAGLAAIASRGGAALVQDPGDARFPGMPRAAIAAVPSAVVAPAVRLTELLGEWAGERVSVTGEPDEALIWETDMIGEGHTDAHGPGRPVALGCPECGGGMREIRTGRAVHYVCHVGHSWSPQAFVAASDEGIEEALWTAISAMQEKVAMLGEMADRAGDEESRREYRAEADRVRHAIDLVRGHLMRDPARPAGPAA
jgi:two-component system chemotaxis response regulator CheB